MAKTTNKSGSKIGRSNALRPATRQMIWAKAAGRCQYRGCNCDLIGDLIAGKEDALFGFVAHIVADAPDGPRGDSIQSAQLADSLSNLMLLCYKHHKLVDVDELATHPVDLLTEMKAVHERRIVELTGIQEDRASHVLCYGAKIGGHESPISFNSIRRDMLPDRYPADGRAMHIEILGASSFQDDKSMFWEMQRRNLRVQFANMVQERIERREICHLSVFGLAPQPLLMELGRLLCDIGEADIHQLHREPKSWRWAEDGPRIAYEEHRPVNTNGVPALILAISATVSHDRVAAVLGPNATIWSVTARNPGNDAMRHKEDLREFRRRLRSILNAIKAAHGESNTIAVFPALPVSAAIEAGRVWMPKADLPLCVYDEQKPRGFIPTIRIEQEPTQAHAW